MKYASPVLPAVLLLYALVTTRAGADIISQPTTPDEPLTRAQASYLAGLQFGDTLSRAGIVPDLDAAELEKGLRDALAGKPFRPEDVVALKVYAAAALEAQATRNETAAHEFLARNAGATGVRTLPSGLQYRVLAPGDAKARPAGASDVVIVNYRGALLDGTEFDNSFKRNVPMTFRANATIEGWQQALALMRPGAKWQMWVPPELGYGTARKPGIPGGSLLVFDVELVRVERQTP